MFQSYILQVDCELLTISSVVGNSWLCYLLLLWSKILLILVCLITIATFVVMIIMFLIALVKFVNALSWRTFTSGIAEHFKAKSEAGRGRLSCLQKTHELSDVQWLSSDYVTGSLRTHDVCQSEMWYFCLHIFEGTFTFFKFHIHAPCFIGSIILDYTLCLLSDFILSSQYS